MSSEVFTGKCPLCEEEAKYQTVLGDSGSIFNCDKCGVFGVSASASRRLNYQELRDELLDRTSHMKCMGREVPYIHLSSDGSLTVDCRQLQ